MKQETITQEGFGPEDAVLEDVESFETEFDDDDDDGFEAVAEFDDDDEGSHGEYDDDDEGEDAEFLGALAPALLGGLPTLIKGASRLISPPRRRRTRRYNNFSRFGTGGGVRGARIRTPRGSAFLRLPKSVVPMSTYKRDLSRLQARDNRLNARINRAQSDITKTDKKAVQALAAAGRADLRVSSLGKKQKRELAKLKDEQKSNATMNLMISMMQMQNIGNQLNNHTHDSATQKVENVGSSNNMMMLMPLMLMDDDGGDDNTMMMMVMMMMMQQQTA